MNRRAIFLLALLLALPAAGRAQTGGRLDQIRQKGVITLGYIEGAAPFSFIGDDRQPQGYSTDLCREIAHGVRSQLNLAKLETRWVALTIQDRLEAVRTGRVDIECSTTTWTLSRQADVDFSLITFVDGGSILTKSGTGGARLLDFDGKRVAVISGTTTAPAGTPVTVTVESKGTVSTTVADGAWAVTWTAPLLTFSSCLNPFLVRS